jgi:Rieske Fe-S protein
MSEDDQKNFEDCLGLDRYIEQLRTQRSARLPDNLTPEEERTYSMATFFHTASPEVTNPRPEFGKQLQQRLLEQMRSEDRSPVPSETPRLAENHGTGRGQTPPLSLPVDIPTLSSQGQKKVRNIYSNNQVSQATPIASIHPGSTDAQKRKRRGLSRRTLFTGGTIAASLLAGAALGATIEHSLEPGPPNETPVTNLNPNIKGDIWHAVAPVKQLGNEPISFRTNTITGYVIRQTQDGNPTDQIIAFSAACTHLGCIVQWKDATRQFPCPCHGRTFDATGKPVHTGKSQEHYTSLPRLDTKIENDHIYVKVPTY